MKIVPVLMKIETLYENRHLYTDDVHYNSLIISNLINKKIELLDFVNYNALDGHDQWGLFVKYPDYYNGILFKDGILRISVHVGCLIFNELQYNHSNVPITWEQCEDSDSDDEVGILAIVD